MIDGENLIDDRKQCVEGGLDRITAIYGNISMQDFMQDLGIRYETLTGSYKPFDQTLGIQLVRVRRSDKIHRDVGVNQDHWRLTLE